MKRVTQTGAIKKCFELEYCRSVDTIESFLFWYLQKHRRRFREGVTFRGSARLSVESLFGNVCLLASRDGWQLRLYEPLQRLRTREQLQLSGSLDAAPPLTSAQLDKGTFQFPRRMNGRKHVCAWGDAGRQACIAECSVQVSMIRSCSSPPPEAID